MKPKRLAIPLVAALALLPSASIAQVPASGTDTAPVCYGFSFGRWTPALDRVAAGHDADARGGPEAPDGRGWATSDSTTAPALILFPGWWPAGVRVTLPSGPPALGQSAGGTAIALVADARAKPPKATIVVRGVPCGPKGGGSAPPPG